MKKLLFFLVLLILPINVMASTIVDGELAGNAKSAILIEASTGKVLYEKNSHEKLPPASMTKIMSMLLVMEAIEKDIIAWDDIITVSKNASSMGGSQILLEENEQMTVADLFKGVAVASGNDAVVALAEAVSGTVDSFVNDMNKKAKELGLKDTNFKNPHGLDEANHYSSAYDMSIMAKELVKHKKVLEYTSIYEDYLRKGTDREFWLVNTNKLVRFNQYVDGLKTGYTGDAGYCLTATAKKDDTRLIAVVMGEESSTIRNSEVTSLLDYGFAKINVKQLVDTDTVVKEIKLDDADNELITIVPKEAVNIVVPKGEKVGKITYDLKLDKIKLPLKKGKVIGSLDILENNELVKIVDVTVDKTVKKANILKLYLRYLRNTINGF